MGAVSSFCACGTKMLEAQHIKVIKLRIILYRIGSPDFIKYGSQTKLKFVIRFRKMIVRPSAKYKGIASSGGDVRYELRKVFTFMGLLSQKLFDWLCVCIRKNWPCLYHFKMGDPASVA